MAVAVIAGFLATGAGPAAAAQLQAGAELTRLLRAMAGLKALMAAAAVAVVLWRLAVPATLPRLAAYAVACGAMAAAPGLIWDMAHVAAGALLLHAGLLATILLLWRDPAMAERLAAILARRRLTSEAVSKRGVVSQLAFVFERRSGAGVLPVSIGAQGTGAGWPPRRVSR